MRSSIIAPAGLADCKTQDLLHTVQGPDGPAALPEPNLIQRGAAPTGEKEIQSMKTRVITAIVGIIVLIGVMFLSLIHI